MSGNKTFYPSVRSKEKNPSSGKDRLEEFVRKLPKYFIELSDTFDDYVGKAGKFLKINETQTGITVDVVGTVVSDKTYVHDQPIANTQWTVQHDLDKEIKAIVVDSTNKIVRTDIVYVDNNSLLVNFDIAVSGKVFCN